MLFRDRKKCCSESIGSSFMATVDDDMLREILLRLPRLGPAITVCKRWYYLIISDHTFLCHTLHHHRLRQNGDPDPSYTAPCTLLFRYRDTDPCLQIHSRKSTIFESAVSRQSPRTLLGFVSDLKSEAIMDSCDGSLLLHVNGEYRIYEPVSREELLIPNPPPANELSRFMLVRSSGEANGISRFRIVKFRFRSSVIVFSSETGQWNESFLKYYPQSFAIQTVAAAGAIYWKKIGSGICVYDPFCEVSDPRSCQLVKFLPEMDKGPSMVGAVRGRFRLSCVVKGHLKIWELKNEKWKLVHEVWLKMEIKGVPLRMEMKGEILEMEIQKIIEERVCGETIGLVAFHPEDVNVIFVCFGFALYECRLKKGEGGRFRKVGVVSDNDLGRIHRLRFSLRVFPLVHHWNGKIYCSESIASRFMATVDDRLLLEILIRLPRLGPAITVCKRWHSLIISHHPNTFLRHTFHHHRRRQNGNPDPSYTAPCTLLFGNRDTEPCLQILSRKSTILEAAMSRQSPRTLLGFVSDLKSKAIVDSFNDSLLLHVNGEYRIYEPVSREELLIPNPPIPNPPPADGWSRFILVGSGEANRNLRFKIVKFRFTKPSSVIVFSSDTGQWKESFLKYYPQSFAYQMVTVAGAIHWRKECSGICVYDPFCEFSGPRSCRIVKFPSGVVKVPMNNISIRLGAVRGRFRLSQMFDGKLSIWELKNDEWKLVHVVWLKMEIKGVPLKMEMEGEILKMEIQKRIENRMSGETMSVVAFHPEDGDVIFVCYGFAIYECQLKDGDGERFRKVGVVADHDPGRIQFLHMFLRVFPLVHPWY